MRAILVLSAALLSTALFAQEGNYVRLNAGSIDVNESGLDDSQTSYGVDLGYRFTDVFGAELGYHDSNDLRGITTPGNFANSANVRILTMAVSAKYALHTAEYQGFYLDARGGLSNTRVDAKQTVSTTSQLATTSNGTQAFVGIGVGYDMTEGFSMGLGYNRYRGKIRLPNVNEKNVDLSDLSLVAEFRF
jgi:opacity protein-like surface antigen